MGASLNQPCFLPFNRVNLDSSDHMTFSIVQIFVLPSKVMHFFGLASLMSVYEATQLFSLKPLSNLWMSVEMLLLLNY